MTGTTPAAVPGVTEEEYEPGEIYEDARGFRYLRVQAGSLPRLPVSGTPLPWLFLDRSGDAVGRLEGIPQRPLRKMVPAPSPASPGGSAAATGPAEGADDRESLGRIVHDIRLACEADQAAAEGRERFRLGSWKDRSDGQRELDMRIGSAIAAQAVHDAGLEAEALRKRLIALSVHFPEYRLALGVAISEALNKQQERTVERFERALEALGGEEP